MWTNPWGKWVGLVSQPVDSGLKQNRASLFKNKKEESRPSCLEEWPRIKARRERHTRNLTQGLRYPCRTQFRKNRRRICYRPSSVVFKKWHNFFWKWTCRIRNSFVMAMPCLHSSPLFSLLLLIRQLQHLNNSFAFPRHLEGRNTLYHSISMSVTQFFSRKHMLLHSDY